MDFLRRRNKKEYNNEKDNWFEYWNFGVDVWGARECVINGYTWFYSTNKLGTAQINNVTPKIGVDLIIPKELDGFPVVDISNYIFRDQYGTGGGFTGVLELPESITSIGLSVFTGCSSLKGALIIPDNVTTIGAGAFQGCSGFTGALTLGRKVSRIGDYAFYNCSGLNKVIAKCSPPIGFKDRSGLWGKKITYCSEYGEAWNQVLKGFDMYNAGPMQFDAQTISIVSSKIRETDPTVMDVVYKVTSSQPTVKVRALAFKDGVRSFANVVRPETFIEGTDANIGDGVAANVEHKLSWKVSADWKETLAKVKFEVLAIEDTLLPLELTTLPKTDSQPKMEVSWNVMFDSWVFDALMWLYADKDLGLTLTSGVLKNGDVRLADGASVGKTMYDATVYVYGKMGYELLQGERLEYARQMLRRNLPNISVAQYAVKVIEE